jgi:hypothetical protein
LLDIFALENFAKCQNPTINGTDLQSRTRINSVFH